MRRIDLFVAGAQKCATTTLHAYLCQHPAMSPPVTKELHFFDNDQLDWGRPDYGALDRSFAPGDDGRMRYDATPIYGYWPPALGRIRSYHPGARLIFLFRDPLARAWSHWCMEFARGHEDMPFADAIRHGRARLARARRDDAAWRHFSYVERGYYGAQVARALRLFPRHQLLFLKTEDFARDHRATLARVAAFLGIAPFADGPPLRENARAPCALPAWPTMADRALVLGEMRHDLALFARLTGMDIREWRAAPQRSERDAQPPRYG